MSSGWVLSRIRALMLAILGTTPALAIDLPAIDRGAPSAPASDSHLSRFQQRFDPMAPGYYAPFLTSHDTVGPPNKSRLLSCYTLHLDGDSFSPGNQLDVPQLYVETCDPALSHLAAFQDPEKWTLRYNLYTGRNAVHARLTVPYFEGVPSSDYLYLYSAFGYTADLERIDWRSDIDFTEWRSSEMRRLGGATEATPFID